MEEIFNYLESITICQQKAIQALRNENYAEFKFQITQAEMIAKLLTHFITL